MPLRQVEEQVYKVYVEQREPVWHRKGYISLKPGPVINFIEMCVLGMRPPYGPGVASFPKDEQAP